MATIGTPNPTLLDWAKRQDPDGGVAPIIEILDQTNPLLDDATFVEGNLPTGHQTTIRTGLPKVYWRKLNQGIPSSKSETKQITEPVGMLESWSNVDKDLAELNGNTNEFRLSESRPFLEAMNQEMTSTAIYGNSATAPEEFSGLATRYSDLSAENSENIIDAGGTGADNTSIWLIVWSPETACFIYPKGSQAGITHEDLGLQTVQTTASNSPSHMRAYQDHWQWKNGLCVRDWRYAVRIANIDISVITGDYDGSDGFTHDLQQLMVRALHRVPNLQMGRPVFYCNRTIRQVLDIQALEKASSQLTVDNFDGKLITKFRGVPVKTMDTLLETEARVV